MKKLVLSDKVFNIMKWIAILVLPTLAGAFIAINHIWGLPYNDYAQLFVYAATIIGVVLGISSVNYYDNSVQVWGKEYFKELYTKAVWFVLYFIPPFIVAYSTLGSVISVPFLEQTVETLIVVYTYMGVVLGLYTTQNTDFLTLLKEKILEMKKEIL